ncbi:hypothetical protein QUV83_14185 [Cellulomonas cellasea]|uniref:hypothetical protein n=1 Tax=Cellulomonas cellasea TaxID=43670 RepID=UPI0025A39434|nr:hypothetical protein [Cellulomonas cellasea]MDM8085921.1 hypothetical protein [Cellulomonas cellasea]
MLTIAYQSRTISVRIPVPTLAWSSPRQQRISPLAGRHVRARARLLGRRRDRVAAQQASRRQADRIAAATLVAREADTRRALALRAGAGV